MLKELFIFVEYLLDDGLLKIKFIIKVFIRI